MRALTALKQAGMASQKTDGRPPEMPLTKIMRDPDNPRPPLHLRTPEEQQKQSELNMNIKRRGVKSPISLRPHPTMPDIWVINHGHCRYDAAEAAGLATIPYFIDPNFDSYDQVAENLHRSDLSIWAIAAFIERKLAEGQSKSEIAERLGKEGQNYVTEHLALVDAPSCIHQAYANTVRSPRTLYDLRRAYDEFPEQVDAWCSSGSRITRDSIKGLLDKLRHDVTGHSALDDVLPSEQQTRHDAPQASRVGTIDNDSQRTKSNKVRSEELRHDVTPSTRTTALPSTPELRHDVTPSARTIALLATPELRHDVTPSARTIALPATPELRHDVTPSARTIALPATPELRHDVTPSARTTALPAASELRHDVEPVVGTVMRRTDSPSPRPSVSVEGIFVRYKGKAARIASDTMVKIVLDGSEDLLEVPCSDLVFEGMR